MSNVPKENIKEKCWQIIFLTFIMNQLMKLCLNILHILTHLKKKEFVNSASILFSVCLFNISFRYSVFEFFKNIYC